MNRTISFKLFIYLIVILFGIFSYALKFQTLNHLPGSFPFFAALDLFRSDSSLYLFLLFFGACFLIESPIYLKSRRIVVLLLMATVLFSAYSLSIFEFLSSESVSINKAVFYFQSSGHLWIDEGEIKILTCYVLPLLLVCSLLLIYFLCLREAKHRKFFIRNAILATIFLCIGFFPPIQKTLPYSISHNALLYLIKSGFIHHDREKLDKTARYDDWKVQLGRRHPEKNLVIVIVDSMQNKVLKDDDPEESQRVMPYLQSLTSSSLVFDQAYGTVPHTTKSLISIFCGVLPYLDFSIPESRYGVPVSCLPKILDGFYYRTVFFQGERGAFEGRGDLLKNMGFQEVMSAETYRPDNQFQSNPGRYDDEYTLDYAKNWLNHYQKRRFFMAFLLSNNAYPYQIPANAGFNTFSKQKSKNANLNALHYSDSVIKNLLDTFRRLGIYHNTVFVFISAHGEAFGEHGKQQHNNVAYNQVSHVMFMIHDGSGGLEKGTNRTTVSQLQVLPSVLDLLGVDAKGKHLPESVFQGGNKAMGTCYEPFTCMYYVDGQYKYIDNFSEKGPELFDIKNDPKESHNLVSEQKKLAENMHYVLKRDIDFNQSALENFFLEQNADFDGEK